MQQTLEANPRFGITFSGSENQNSFSWTKTKTSSCTFFVFARTWGSLLKDALDRGTPEAWFDYASFPKCILLAPIRGGSEQAGVSKLENQISQAIVSRNSVAGLLAAQGVVPK